MIVLLAIACIGGAIVLAGAVGLNLYSAQRNNLQVTCNELQEAPRGSAQLADVNVEAGIGLVPLGVWCTYPAGDGGSITVPPSWALTGVAWASVGLLVVGLVAARAQVRLGRG